MMHRRAEAGQWRAPRAPSQNNVAAWQRNSVTFRTTCRSDALRSPFMPDLRKISEFYLRIN